MPSTLNKFPEREQLYQLPGGHGHVTVHRFWMYPDSSSSMLLRDMEENRVVGHYGFTGFDHRENQEILAMDMVFAPSFSGDHALLYPLEDMWGPGWTLHAGTQRTHSLTTIFTLRSKGYQPPGVRRRVHQWADYLENSGGEGESYQAARFRELFSDCKLTNTCAFVYSGPEEEADSSRVPVCNTNSPWGELVKDRLRECLGTLVPRERKT